MITVLRTDPRCLTHNSACTFPMSCIPIATHSFCVTSSYIDLFTSNLVPLARAISFSEFLMIFLLVSLHYHFTARLFSYSIQLETLSLASVLDLSQNAKKWCFFGFWLSLLFVFLLCGGFIYISFHTFLCT